MAKLETAIGRPSVVNLVLERVKDALISQELKPGDRLPTEMELCRSLNVGRTSVREAVKMLEALGVAEVRRGDGTYISESLNASSLNPLIFALALHSGTNADLVELRLLVEIGYVQLAIDKITDQDIRKLAAIVEKQRVAVLTGDAGFGELDLEFHYTILNATRNPFVIELGRTVLELFRASIIRTSTLVPARSLEDHERILQAISVRDKSAAQAAVFKSFEVWKEYVRLPSTKI